MCGINGIFVIEQNNNFPVEDHIIKMNAAIRHRGTDFSDYRAVGSGVLGHCRLSIQDLSSSANQPFIKHGLVLVYNGEIYNFRELKSELRDVEWLTDSDTELLLELWRREGVNCLNKLRGMFAFAIYDLANEELYICRDHFGIKPLYYYSTDDLFIFSSELKAIKQCGVGLSVDFGVVAESLLLCWIRDSQCIFSEVKKLQPGYYIRFKNNRVEVSEYWSPRSLLSQKIQQNTDHEWISGLDDVLQKSVKAHLVSDVPVGAFLSGGLDSSLLVAMAAKQVDDLSCYTIKFSDADKRFEKMADDHYYAERVAKNFGLKLNTIDVKPDLAKLLETVVHHLDEPIGDSAAINTYIICEGARASGIKVLISGAGADEIFAGYRKHLANMYAQRYKNVPEPIRNALSKSVSLFPSSGSMSGYKFIRWAKRFLSFANLEPVDAFLRSYTYYDIANLIDGCNFDASAHLSSLRDTHQDIFLTARNYRSLIDAMCFTDLTQFMVGLNLHYTDRSSMAHSTEVRVPFIDREVVEYSFSMPDNMKIRNRAQKYILKKVAENWLPQEIIYRPKSPFTLPLRSWIKNNLDSMVSDYILSDTGLMGRGIFQPTFLLKLVKQEREGIEDNAQKIWHLLTLEQWFKNNMK